MPVPAEAVNINFGFLLSGTGSAWFDGATVELDGVRQPLDDLDLGFESDAIQAGYATHDRGYTSFLDPDVAHVGRQSLRLASASSGADAVDAGEAAQEALAVLQEMRSQRTAWLAAQPAPAVERALFNARLVHQCLSARAAAFGNPRDGFMAENVAWLSEQHPDARIVLWAHNYHVSRQEGAMGAYLDAQFGDAYRPVGFATARGRYYAYSRSDQRVHDLQLPPDDSFEARFVRAEAPVFALDLRMADPASLASGWLCEERPFRLIGAMAMDEQFQPTRLRDLFDLVVFVKESTPAQQLGTPPARN
jgi:erythromycin esterase-like protein